MKIGYLINQYPHVSHSFIRREIAALEEAGVSVLRFSVRPSPEKLVDPGDVAERDRTAVLLAGGLPALLLTTLVAVLVRPLAWARALAAAVRMGRRSERGVLRHLIYLAEACKLAQCLRRDGCTHVHAHFGTNSATVARLAHLVGGVTYSFTVHGPEEFDHPEALSLGEKVDGAAFVVAISHFTRSQLLRWAAPTAWDKIHVVHCGVDALFLRDGRPVPDVARLVCVGRLAEQKGQLVLIDAVAELARRNVPVEVVLVGDGPMRPLIEQRIRDHDVADRVQIAGWMSNEAVRDEILAARSLVLPSFAEGLPVVLMEALGLGRPVVTTYVAGIPELVRDGENGWLVPASSVDALADAVVEVLRLDPAELDRRAARGAARVAEQHDARTEGRRLAAIFRDTLCPPVAERPPAAAAQGASA